MKLHPKPIRPNVEPKVDLIAARIENESHNDLTHFKNWDGMVADIKGDMK